MTTIALVIGGLFLAAVVNSFFNDVSAIRESLKQIEKNTRPSWLK